MSFLEELVKKGTIQENQIALIKNLAKERFGGDLDAALLESGVSEENILVAKSEYLKLPWRKVNIKGISFDVLKYIPEDSALYYHFAPFALEDGVLLVGITDPENIQAMDALQFIIFLIGETDYKEIMNMYKGISTQVEEALEEIDQSKDTETKKNRENLNKEMGRAGPGEEKIVEDAPVIKIVAVILKNAIEGGASDIHIEHTGEKVK